MIKGYSKGIPFFISNFLNLCIYIYKQNKTQSYE